MNLEMYSVFDEKARAFITPMFFQNEDMARREIYNVVNSRQSSLHRHPKDYSLYRLGKINMSTGQTEPEKTFIEECINMVNQEDETS